MFRVLVRHTFKNRSLRSSSSASSTEQPWKDPWKHAVSKQNETYTDVEELKIDWKYVERLMPIETIPKVPHHEKYPTPSGWQPPRTLAGELPYFVERRRDHLFPLYLERRRDQLDEKTIDFEYVELINIRNIDGDVFAFDTDLRQYLEKRLGQKVASHVDELKGRVKVKGAQRSDIEAFLLEKGF